jgi:hypothetical protein
MSDRVQGSPSPIPGGKEHIGNAPAFRHKVPAPAPDEFTDQPVDNAHGVAPGTHTGATRGQMVRGKLAETPGEDQYYTEQQRPPRPIPVYVVDDRQQAQVYRTAGIRNYVISASTGTPTRICGRDPKRSHVMLLNESSSSNIRFATTERDLNNGGGALLPWPSNSYVKLETQDELYAISADSGTPALSVVQVFDHGGTGL